MLSGRGVGSRDASFSSVGTGSADRISTGSAVYSRLCGHVNSTDAAVRESDSLLWSNMYDDVIATNLVTLTG